MTDTGASDFELLEAWRGGDNDAANELFDRHLGAIYRFFASKVDDGVDDLLQRTFAACVESRDRFRGDSSFRTFLFAIARHELYSHFRSRKKAANLDFGVSSLHDISPGPVSLVAKHTEQRLLLAALRHIPLDLQIAVELHYWEGLTGPQLAEVLGVPEGTVRSRLRRAKQALHAAITELAEDGAPVQNTIDNLEKWAASLKDIVPERE